MKIVDKRSIDNITNLKGGDVVEAFDNGEEPKFYLFNDEHRLINLSHGYTVVGDYSHFLASCDNVKKVNAELVIKD